jgi:hypothetical protein
MTKDAAFKRRVRARMTKTGEWYATARRQVDRAERGAPRRPAATLHVTNGDSAALGLRAAVHLTASGGEVLAGRADHVRLNGVDRWIGGTHLTGTGPAGATTSGWRC